MKPCCPPGEGCNRPPGLEESCWLLRLERTNQREAGRALDLWSRYRHRYLLAGAKERRALRRAYARVRDRVLEPGLTRQRIAGMLR